MSDQDYRWLGETPLQWRTFLDTPPSEADPGDARVFVIPVPYDSTTSYKTGARYGPAAIIDASRHLEDYDIELDRDISEVGIHTTPEVQPNMDGPKAMIDTVSVAVKSAASRGKLTAMLGGEHTVTVGAVQAYSDLHEDLSVLYIDAHADLRESYQGTRWGHASVARRIYEICPLILVGIRSVSAEEMNFIKGQGIPTQFWSAQPNDNIRQQLLSHPSISATMCTLASTWTRSTRQSCPPSARLNPAECSGTRLSHCCAPSAARQISWASTSWN